MFAGGHSAKRLVGAKMTLGKKSMVDGEPTEEKMMTVNLCRIPCRWHSANVCRVLAVGTQPRFAQCLAHALSKGDSLLSVLSKALGKAAAVLPSAMVTILGKEAAL